MKWLDIHTQITVKTIFGMLTGIKFEQLAFMFAFKKRMDIMYNKLKMEGYE